MTTPTRRQAKALLAIANEQVQIHTDGIARCAGKAGYERAERAHVAGLAKAEADIAKFSAVPADAMYRLSLTTDEWIAE